MTYAEAVVYIDAMLSPDASEAAEERIAIRTADGMSEEMAVRLTAEDVRRSAEKSG